MQNKLEQQQQRVSRVESSRYIILTSQLLISLHFTCLNTFLMCLMLPVCPPSKLNSKLKCSYTLVSHFFKLSLFIAVLVYMYVFAVKSFHHNNHIAILCSSHFCNFPIIAILAVDSAQTILLWQLAKPPLPLLPLRLLPLLHNFHFISVHYPSFFSFVAAYCQLS